MTAALPPENCDPVRHRLAGERTRPAFRSGKLFAFVKKNEVFFVDQMLSTDLFGWQLSFADPAPDCFGIASSAPGRFRNC